MIAARPKDYQVLLDHPRGGGMVVSCYADTSVAEGFKSHWRQHLKAEATRIRGFLAGDSGALREFERQLEAIRCALESREARQARGMAVFIASGWDQATVLSSDEPYEDRIFVGEEPYLVPLLVADDRRREFLAVQADTHRGRIYASSSGAARLLDELDEPLPRVKNQTTTERHRRERNHHFQRKLARRVEKAWDAHATHGILLLGGHEVVESIRGALPRRLAARVVHEAPLAWTESPHEIRDRVREVVAAAIDGQRTRLLEEIGRRIQEGFAVATGPQEVIGALVNGQAVELVLGPDPGEVASRCAGCRSLFAIAKETCPYCQASCARANLWQEILTHAVRHDIAVHFITPDPRRDVPGGVAALLARDEPPWSPEKAGADETVGIPS
ncbi:MAG: hypothetical protein JOZ63_06535 [Planctomycetaceae bacterium]|nr:hypothetical protein [Planctomycetaceae bacterium]